jgi:sulfide:quinone oxidoreductase
MTEAKTVLILGGGWGGLTAAHNLRGLLPEHHRILVIERSPTFSLGVSNLGLMTGKRESVHQIQREMAKLKRPGIEWIQAEVRSVDPEARIVETDAGTFAGDYLVLALGAELVPESIDGFAESAFNLYEPEEAAALHSRLEQFDSGRITVLVAGAPFRCPAAPYEAAMLIEAWVRENGVRDRVEIDLYTPESIPMAVAGPAVGQGLCAFMDQRNISYHFNHQVTEIDRASKTVRFEQGEVTFDLLVGIPPHRAPMPLQRAGLVDSSGYVPVHPQTLEILSDPDTLQVQYPGVYAIGDVAAIRLMNSMLLPKAGVFAEGEAHVVAAAIAADIEGTHRPGVYDGDGFCYVEVGDGVAAYGSGDFYAFPGPRVTLDEPSADGLRAKQEYETLLDTWFYA